MADIVNLRQARKHKARVTKDRQAAENRAKFGRTKGEKAREDATAERTRAGVDQARLDDEA